MNAEDRQESPCGLARQSEAKRKQAPQSEANECRRRKCNLRWPVPIYMRVGYVFCLRFFRMKDPTDFYDFLHP